MKRICNILVLTLFANLAFAQDYLYLNDGQVIQAVIEEVTPDLVKYRRYDNQAGPLYSVQKTEVMKVRYSTGLEEFFDANGIPKTNRPNIPETVPDLQEPEVLPPLPEESDAPVDESQPPPPATISPVVPDQPEKRFPAFHAGVFAGFNAATGYYQYHNAPEPPILSLLPAPSVGGRVELQLAKAFSFSAALAYRGKGDRIDVFDWLDKVEQPADNGPWEVLQSEADGYIQTYMGFAELSLMPVVHAGESFRIGAGGYAAVGLHGKEKSDYRIDHYLAGELFYSEEVKSTRKVEFVSLIGLEDTEEVRYINRLDYGLTGLMEFGHRPLTVALSLSFGLQNWEPENDLFGEGNNPTETRHVTGMLSVTYWLTR